MRRGGLVPQQALARPVPASFFEAPLEPQGSNLNEERRIRTPVGISQQILSLPRLATPASPRDIASVKRLAERFALELNSRFFKSKTRVTQASPRTNLSNERPIKD